MLIHPWDAAQSDDEWREWLESTDMFGVLVVNNLEPTQAPFVIPAHFALAGPDIVLHLARPNPVWPHLEAATEVRLAVIGDYAYIPSYWRANADAPASDGVPTSYYASVQFVCRPTVIDEPAAKIDILTTQLHRFQPEGGHGPLSETEPPYGRLLSGLRGIHLEVLRVDAKFKYDDAKPVEHRERVTEQLRERGHGLDRAAAAQQQRRLGEMGDWSARQRPSQ